MKRYARFILMMVLVAAVSACATNKMQMKHDNIDPSSLAIPSENQEDYRDIKIEEMMAEFLLEPYDATGVKETPALLRKNVSWYKVPFPAELEKERPQKERIRFYVLVMANGHRHTGQMLKMDEGSEADLLVDGDAETLKNAKAFAISTMAKKGYSLSSPDEKGVEIDRKRLMSDPVYRSSLIETGGTPLANFKPSAGLVSIINTWNRFETPRGFLLTPLEEKRFREIVAINPGYSHSQRWAEYGKHTISTDLIGTLVSQGMDHIKAEFSPTTGWDFDSKPPPPEKKDRR
jgi:hypothetical protein